MKKYIKRLCNGCRFEIEFYLFNDNFIVLL